jgi:hypothetical protein
MPAPSVDTHARSYPPAELQSPSTAGFIYIAAEIDPPSRPGPVRETAVVREALAAALPRLGRLGDDVPVVAADVFHAAGFPPLSVLPIPADQHDHVARYDVVALIETQSAATAAELLSSPRFGELRDGLQRSAHRIEVVPVANVKNIAEPPRGDRLHLFNHFLTSEPAPALDLWDQLAGWYEAEMDLHNSMVLAPLDPDGAPFAFVNHASWNVGVGRFIAKQISRRSFRSFVIANLRDHGIGALPFLYHRVTA